MTATGTSWWMSEVQSWYAGSEVLAVAYKTLGLLATVLLVALVFVLATRATRGLTSLQQRAMPGELGHSLVPIVVGYVGAHYLSYLVEKGQRTIIALADPLDRGWDLLNLGGLQPSYWLSEHPHLLAVLKVGLVLTGHVLGSMIQTMLSVAVVTGVALLIGFRPSATPVEWVATAGVLAMISLALTWLCVAFGLVTKTVEAASNLPTPLVFLPFLGSGFVPTDSLPVGLRWFAEYQPFTPVIETVRGLLVGTAIGNSAVLAVAWCVGITLVSFLWARRLYNRDPIR